MNAIAFIPARGGSKRLPRKNVMDFQGQPIIAYSIRAAFESGQFSDVVVSTDDREIADVARAHGARVSARSPELATDTARVLDACLDFLRREREDGRDHRVLCCLYATAPLRRPEDIVGTVGLLDAQCQFAMAVTTFDLPVHQALAQEASGRLAPLLPDLVNLRSQDAPPIVVDNGSTYAVDVRAFEQEQTFYGTSLRGWRMPRDRSIDIDTAEDLERALWVASRPASRS